MVEVSYLAAFFGGVLCALKPMLALSSYRPSSPTPSSRARHWFGKTAVFYLGLCVTLVPLGMGISAVSKLVTDSGVP
jgi:cytochrome c biogenesis protein CcdA